MSKEINNEAGETNQAGKVRKFRMAYSLNNWQPVQCTLVSDQPFFYMDEEADFEDDAILAEQFDETYDLSNETLLDEIHSMKNKMDAYERLSETHTKKDNQSLEQFILDGKHLVSSTTDINASINAVTSLLSESRMGKHLIDFAAQNNISIKHSTQVETASFDKEGKAVFVRADLDKNDQVLLLAQELRRVWQEYNDANVNPLTLHPDEAIIMNRAQSADLAVAIVRCAWELKLLGHTDIWARIEHSSMSDLGRALAREALSDFRSLNNGKASSAVFETWFLSERARHEDKSLINSMLADYRGYMFESKDMNTMKLLDLICKLGAQPFGKNYLSAYAQMIIGDTLFTEVRDRSNANFLWFIKFERSFKETERELQSSNTIKIAEINGSENNTFEDTDNENERNACAFAHSAPIGGNIITVQFGRDQSRAERV